jgi:hypothetical protein
MGTGNNSYLRECCCPVHGTQRADYRGVYFRYDIVEASRVRCRFPNSFVDNTKCSLDRWMETTASGIGGTRLLIGVSRST